MLFTFVHIGLSQCGDLLPYAPIMPLAAPASALALRPSSYPALTLRSTRPGSLALLLAMALTLSGCLDKGQAKNGPAGPKEPVTVGVITVKAESQTLSTDLPGRASAVQNADIRPQVSGIIRKRLFTEGAMVKAGQPLYQIDPAPFEVALASAKAALSKAEAAARLAEINVKRNAELVKLKAISTQAFDESQAAAQQTSAEVAAAQAALANARINLDYTRILAPIGGRIGLSSVTLGALVTANQAASLATINQLDPIHVDVTQSSTELLQLRRDLEAGRYEQSDKGSARIRIVLEDGTPYTHPGQLKFSGVNVNPGTGAITLRAVVPNPDSVLLPGMYLRAKLETGVVPQALLVPQQAVMRDLRGKSSVLLVGADNKVERRPLSVEAAIGNRWLVTAGLSGGEKVLVEGMQRVKPGDVVKTTDVVLAKANSPR